MDVLKLIDRLHDLVHDAKHVPLSSEVRVDKEKLDDLLNEMRATIPEEIKEAALDRQGAPGDARRRRTRGGTDPRRGAPAPDPARPRASPHGSGRARSRGHHRRRPR